MCRSNSVSELKECSVLAADAPTFQILAKHTSAKRKAASAVSGDMFARRKLEPESVPGSAQTLGSGKS